jgi:hypothetical protein
LNEQQARRLVRERSAGICERCGHARAINFHHRKNRSQGGLWCPTNAADLCGSGTTGCHGEVTEHPHQAREEGGWVVWSHEDPAAIPIRHWQWGWVLPSQDGCFTFTERPAA